LSKEAPYYTKGYSICIAFTVLTIITATIYVFGIRRENQLREQGRAGIVVTDPDEEGEIGDLNRSFRYIL
jgi:hypothetical protein